MLHKDQIEQLETKDRILGLNAKVEELQRDKQFLKNQVELLDDDFPEEQQYEAVAREHMEEKRKLEEVIV